MLRLSGHTASSHTAMLQPLKLGRFLCGLCKGTVNSSNNVGSSCWGVGKRCEGRGGGLIWGIIPIRTCLKEPTTTTKDVNQDRSLGPDTNPDLPNTKQDRDIWWHHRLVIVTNGRLTSYGTKKENQLLKLILIFCCHVYNKKSCIMSHFRVTRIEFWTKLRVLSLLCVWN